ncbi:hypothetical protein RI367_000315 [Sorochytrium milnesiophthora]
MIAALAAATGIPEPSLRLLVSLLAQYPAAAGARMLLSPQYSAATRNLYTLATGSAIAYLFCRNDIVHPLATVVATWLLCRVCASAGVRHLAGPLALLFNFVYLLGAYVVYASDDYDINWTTPQAVLCLRLIGYAFDVSDGKKSSSSAATATATAKKATTATAVKAAASAAAEAAPTVFEGNVKASVKAEAAAPARSAPHVPTAWAGDISLPKQPSLLETLAFAFHFSGFLVGPQFSFSLYKRYLTLELFQPPTTSSAKQPSMTAAALTKVLQTSKPYALRTFGTAVAYLAVTQVLQAFFPSSALLTKAYLAQSLPHRAWTLWWCGKTALTKYVGVWLLTEGACILSGIAIDGFNNDNGTSTPRWNGLTNLNVVNFELATSLSMIIANFNINTNHWAKLYLFKRLRFLGNKNLSALGTLAFLALWHGFHVGYAYAFSLEFVDMEAERRLAKAVEPWVQRTFFGGGGKDGKAKSSAGGMLVSAVCWLLTTSALYYAAVGFDLLKWHKIRVAAGSVYWSGHWSVLLIILATTLLKQQTRKTKRE